MTQQSHCWAYTLRKPELKETCTPMFVAALFTIVRTCKQSKMSIGRWMDKEVVVHIHKGILSSVQSLNRVQLFVTPWSAARQASLSITNSQTLLKLMSIESVMPFNNLILSSQSPPALNLSQHQGLFKWVSPSHQVAKVLEFQLQHQSFQWTPRTDFL